MHLILLAPSAALLPAGYFRSHLLFIHLAIMLSPHFRAAASHARNDNSGFSCRICLMLLRVAVCQSLTLALFPTFLLILLRALLLPLALALAVAPTLAMNLALIQLSLFPCHLSVSASPFSVESFHPHLSRKLQNSVRVYAKSISSHQRISTVAALELHI
jgi:hypothetical protein